MYPRLNWRTRSAVHLILLLFAWLASPSYLLGDSSVTLHPIWSHAHGRFDKSAAEVVACLPQRGRVYVTNADEDCVDVLDLKTGELIARWDLSKTGSPTA